jgi:hypothetical protein
MPGSAGWNFASSPALHPTAVITNILIYDIVSILDVRQILLSLQLLVCSSATISAQIEYPPETHAIPIPKMEDLPLEYTGNDIDADMKKMAADPTVQRWWKATDPCQIPLPAAAAKGKIWTDMKELYFMP